MIRRYTNRKVQVKYRTTILKYLRKNNNVFRNEEEHLIKIENVSVILVTRQRYRLLQRYYNIKIRSKNQHHPLPASHVNNHFVKYCTLGVLY